MTNNYINEAIKNPKYIIYLNGKEVKRLPFYKQAINYCHKHNGQLFGNTKIELLDSETGEIKEIS